MNIFFFMYNNFPVTKLFYIPAPIDYKRISLSLQGVFVKITSKKSLSIHREYTGMIFILILLFAGSKPLT